MIYRCGRCGGRTRACFPRVTGPAQYGPRVRAAAVYLNVQQLIPEDRTAQAMADLFGAAGLCPASLVAWGERKAEAFAPVAARITTLVAQAPVRHLDETGFRVAGEGRWLHTASPPSLTFYRVTAKRGALPKDFRGGVIVHDHFKPYYRLPRVRHGLCNAHHLRELKALIDIDKEQWAGQMRDLLIEANAAVSAARAEDAKALPAPVLRTPIKRYNAIVRRGLAVHRSLPPLARRSGSRGRAPHRPGHNLLIRLNKFKHDVLRFLNDFAVPFTNNEAERDLRMTKVKTKISGGFRTLDGARTFARLRSVIATARKQGWNILQTLDANPADIIHALAA